ncbi:MAG: homocysteine S-methyltransferase [Actinomycetota bacterium]|nr:homocysteine S-methyltransferase [Actinomycetota bacterium]
MGSTGAVARLRERLASEVLLLDGGLATRLEDRGVDLSGHLWSARIMLEDPAQIAGAQRDFLLAGAQVVTTATYQASHQGFAAVGLDAGEVDVLLVADARSARQVAVEWADADGDVLVVGSIGPYGAMLNDGSEYRGDYDVPSADLREFHARRIEVLAAECDVLALETIPQLREVEALLELVDGLGVPAWLSVSAVGDRLRSGEPAVEAFAMAAGVDEVVAVGANCIDPVDAVVLAGLAAAESGQPAVVYPNSGESWTGGVWSGDPTAPTDVTDWVDAGAGIAGGCCRVTPDHIAAMARSLGR